MVRQAALPGKGKSGGARTIVATKPVGEIVEVCNDPA